MNIINKKLDEVAISDLTPGDVFIEGDDVFMSTSNISTIDVNRVWCVNLRTGSVNIKDIECKVIPCRNAEIWI